MSSKLIHLRSATPGLVPATTELVAGQIAINTADKRLFILGADNTVAIFESISSGTVTSVNGQTPNSSGAVTLTPTNLGATTVGNAVFTASSATAARTAIGSGTIGDQVFTSTTITGALTVLGGSTVGRAVFTATDAPTALSALGATAIGQTLFTSASASAALSSLGGVASSLVGAANGIAPLDATAKIPSSYLPASIVGSVNFQGTFTPGTTTLPAAAASNKGWYYIASAAGTYTPPSGTLLTFNSGDYIISEGVHWSTIAVANAVTSVNGMTGAVVISASNITTGTFGAAQLGASSGNNLVLTTNGSGAPTWVSTLAASNLPTASAAALGVAQAGTGLSVSGGVFSVNTSVLTLDEGTYTGS